MVGKCMSGQTTVGIKSSEIKTKCLFNYVPVTLSNVVCAYLGTFSALNCVKNHVVAPELFKFH